MKKTLIKDSVRNIFKRKISYLAILLTITIGFTGLLCIFFMAQSFERGTSEFYGRTNLRDIEIIASSGFSEENLSEISATEYISDSEGVYSAEAMLRGKASTKSITVCSVPQRISVPECSEGTMPSRDGECAIDEALASRMGLQIGDTVTINLKSADLDGFLKSSSFKITATMINPHMLSRSTANTVMVTTDAFDTEITQDGYTSVYAMLNIPDRDGVFSDKYLSQVSETIEKLDPVLTDIAKKRSVTLKADLEDKYDDAKREADEKLSDAKKKIDDSQKKLDNKVKEAQKEIDKNERKINKNEKKLEKELNKQKNKLKDSEDELSRSEAELSNAKDKLAKGRSDYAKSKKKLDDAKKEYEKSKQDLKNLMSKPTDGMSDKELMVHQSTIAAMQKAIREGAADIKKTEAKLSAAKRQLDTSEGRIVSSEAELNAAKRELDSAKDKLSDFEKKQRKKLADAREEIKTAKSDLEKERTKYQKKVDDAKSEYEDKKQEADEKLADAKRDIDNLKDCNVVVQDRRMNPSYEEIRSTISSINMMGVFFSPLFAIVGSIVFFSTIAIIIDEQKKQVGTLKALGFRDGRIRVKYLIFGVSSAIVGGAFGIILSALLERSILKTLEDRYSFGRLPVVMSPVVATILCTATVVIVYLVVWAACAGLLKCSAVGLISGSEPVQKARLKAKKKLRKRSLYSELIINNIKTDKARVIVGITVIAASGLLMGAGITLKSSFGTAFSMQETNIGKYDMKVMVSENISDATRTEIEDIISSSGAKYAKGYSGGTVYETKKGGYGTSMLVMDEKEMPNYFNIGAPAKDGISISSNIAKAYRINKGDTIKVFGRSLEGRDTEVKETFDYYVSNMIYMSSQEYEKLFDDECTENCYYVRLDGNDGKALMEKLNKQDEDYSGYLYVETSADETATVESLQDAFDFIAIIFVVLAAALNFLIMINLTNIQVSRRMKELQVMRVNGFSVRQVVGYLVRESLFTTIFGIVLSVVGGIPFSVMLVSAVSNTSLTLPGDPSVFAWTMSVMLSVQFAFVIDFISFRKVKKVSIVVE